MKVGSLVECVETLPYRFPEEKDPVKGNIYTVREIVTYNEDTGIMLEEIINEKQTYKNGFSEVAFDINGFRELQPPMTIDMAIFEPQKMEA